MADFATVEADTKAQEIADQKAYDQSMSDNDIEMSRRRTETNMKSDEKKRRTDKIALLTSQKKDTQGELDKTNQYLTDLRPACVNGDSSYTDRKQARADEIEALRRAQNILLDAFKAQGNSNFLQIRAH